MNYLLEANQINKHHVNKHNEKNQDLPQKPLQPKYRGTIHYLKQDIILMYVFLPKPLPKLEVL